MVIDEDESFRFLVSSIIMLSDRFEVVGEFVEFGNALKSIHRIKPDIVISSFSFSGLGPAECVKALMEKDHLVNLLIVSEWEYKDHILDCIIHGAVGYLSRDRVATRLLEYLESMANGESPIDFRIARMLVERLQVSKATPLTRQESVVLKLVAEGKTSTMIADELCISNETSKTHIRNIYRKLNVNTKTQAVRKAITERLVRIG